MSPHPALHRDLRDAIRQATHDLDSLKLNTAKDIPRVAHMRRELRDSLLKEYERFAKEAQCMAVRARELSAVHSRDSAQMKKFSKDAADFLAAGLKRHLKN
jgi:small-conductance mechanosensitive channel